MKTVQWILWKNEWVTSITDIKYVTVGGIPRRNFLRFDCSNTNHNNNSDPLNFGVNPLPSSVNYNGRSTNRSYNGRYTVEKLSSSVSSY